MNPQPPLHTNHIAQRHYINGSLMRYQIIDEIVHVPNSNPDKAIYLQLLRFEDDGREEMRLCYYMIGYRGRTKGKWVYAQFAPMLGKDDFDLIISKAREKGWVS